MVLVQIFTDFQSKQATKNKKITLTLSAVKLL
jgi:hypothetical protein